MFIKVDVHKIKVEFVDDIVGYDGLFFPLQKKITLLKKPDTNFKEVVVHEVTHVYLWVHGHDGAFKMDVEMVCTFFEHFGERIINDANRIVKYWEEKYGDKS